ncbi:class I SAM-dependent methyltransferase [Actinoplanes xinjiangensis]|uniref:class I SAM-dependent methyltransferase n=1 Tax=Actinoplanes xinjiangensis TaxID=512350 RepID=UPI00343D4302
MDAADFYTGIVVDAYAKLKSAHFDPAPYAEFIAVTGQPALEIGCGDGEPLLELVRRGLDIDGLDSSRDMLERCRINAAALGVDVTLYHQRMEQSCLCRDGIVPSIWQARRSICCLTTRRLSAPSVRSGNT